MANEIIAARPEHNILRIIAARTSASMIVSSSSVVLEPRISWLRGRMMKPRTRKVERRLLKERF